MQILVIVANNDEVREWLTPPFQYALRLHDLHVDITSVKLLTLGTHAQRGLQYLVCVSVCVSVTQHLTFHVITRATKNTNLLSGG